MPFTAKLAKAIQTNDLKLVASLITEEKAWDDPNEEGLKPIHVAIDYGHLVIVYWLLKNRVSLECATFPDGSTPLHRAAIRGQTKIIERLLKVYQDKPNKKRADGVTPLYFAALKGHRESVALLLDHGADICQANNDGLSPLIVAAYYGHGEIVKLLLDRGADIRQANKNGASPLYIAAEMGRTETAKLLLDRGADIGQVMNDGSSPLYIAAQNGHTETVKLLLEHDADIGQATTDGTSPLSVAAQNGHTETVKLMLYRGANIRQADNEGFSPLIVAAQNGYMQTVKLLLDCGADIGQANKNGASPLFVAAQEGHTETVALLLEHKADIGQAMNDGTSPLSVAAQNGHTETVKLLLDRGADIGQADNDGFSPLFVAAQEGHTETVALLLEYEADIVQAHKDGASPLFVAAQEGHTETVTLLLDRGADIRQADNDGTTPLSVAAENGHTETVKLLLDRGADIGQANKNGASPLYIAAYNGRKETVELLLDCDADFTRSLNYAIVMRQREVVALLLDCGADLNQADINGLSPLSFAISMGQKEVVTLLLDYCADINQAVFYGISSLNFAIIMRQREVVALLLDYGADFNQADINGLSSLNLATRFGQMEVVELLLDHGADIGQAMNDSVSPLSVAAQNGHTETVKLLLEHKADINQPNKNGASPLYVAAAYGYPEIAALLLRNGALLEQATFNKQTPLWIAAHEGHDDVVRILLTNGALMTPDDKGDTPLHIAVKQSHLALIKLLLSKNAVVTSLNAEKQTPLCLAARLQDAIMFGCLLAAAWFQQPHLFKTQEVEHKQDLERKKILETNFSIRKTDDISDYIKKPDITKIQPKELPQWLPLPLAALTLAKAMRQSHSLEISQEQLKAAPKLGEGAFGEVFQVTLPFVDFALKLLKLEQIAEWFKVSEQEARDILQWEISQLEKVRHPHVVELLSVAHSDTPLLAMELCDTTLDKVFPKTDYYQWQIAWEVACGLAYLHDLGFVHRDIKPENILLKDGIAKISDMGLARIDPMLLDKPEPAQLEKLIGATLWASPEEKAAFEAYHKEDKKEASVEDIKKASTAASDIYRYGLVLYTFGISYNAEPNKLFQSFLSPIIKACLQQEPEDRPSALQVLNALESNIPHPHPVLAKLCQRLGIFAHYYQHELAHFLIPWVSPKPDIDWLTYQEGIEVTANNAPQPFNTLWDAFLVNPNKSTLDLRGTGGLGKTLLGYYQLKEQWQALRQWLIKPQGNPPAIVLLLTPDYLPTTAFTIEERLAEIYQLNRKECETLKQYPVIFLCDGEDEWQARPKLDLNNWPNAKAWIVGRPSASAKDSVYLLPFNQIQIVNYLRQTLTWDEATTRDFITQLPTSAIKDVIRNPFILSMFRLLWPIADWQKLTKEAIYHTYFTQFIERQQQHWLTGPYQKIYKELIKHLQQQHPTLSESYLHFAGEVSLQLFEARRLEGKVIVDSPWTTMPEKVQCLAENAFEEKQQLLLANNEKSRLSLKQYQAFAHAHLNRFVLFAPLELGYYRFRHKSLFEYAWAYSALIPNRPLDEDEALLTTYALIHQKEKEEKLDFGLIEASKKNPALSHKAGNILTLYNWARLPLTYDYQNAYIENANLAYANLIEADFRNAHLSNCYFAHACIEKARFDKAIDRIPQQNRAHPPLLGHNQQILYSALSPNGQLLATSHYEQVFIWHNHHRVGHFLIHIEAPTALAIDDNGEILIGDEYGYVYFYSGNTRQRKLHACSKPILGVQFISEDSCWVGSATNIAIYHCKDFTYERQWYKYNSVSNCVALCAILGQHAFGALGGAFAMNTIQDTLLKSLIRFRILHGPGTALSFSVTGNFGVGGEDGQIEVYDKDSHYSSKTFYSNQPISSLHWSQDGQLLVAITSQGFKIWNVSTRRELGNFKANAIQAIYLKNSHEGILVEKSGNLYGIILKDREINITWVVAGKHFQDGIVIQPINEDPVKEQLVKEQEEEKKVQPLTTQNNHALLTTALQQQGVFADRNQSIQRQGVNSLRDAVQQTSSSLHAREFKQDR